MRMVLGVLLKSNLYFKASVMLSWMRQLAISLTQDVYVLPETSCEMVYNLTSILYLQCVLAPGRDCQGSKRSYLCRIIASSCAGVKFSLAMVTEG